MHAATNASMSVVMSHLTTAWDESPSHLQGASDGGQFRLLVGLTVGYSLGQTKRLRDVEWRIRMEMDTDPSLSPVISVVGAGTIHKNQQRSQLLFAPVSVSMM